jgi:predicted nucleic acid-binding protein
MHQEWRQMLVDYSISGVQVHDARLVAAMRIHGAKQILTFSAIDFRRFADREAVHPQDLVAPP